MDRLFLQTILLIGLLSSAFTLTTSCSDTPEGADEGGTAWAYSEDLAMRFTEEGLVGVRFKWPTEEVHVDSEEQIITLRFLRLEPTYKDPDLEMADTFDVEALDGSYAYRWEEECGEVWPSMIDPNSEFPQYDDSWYEVWTEIEEGKTVIKIKLDKNDNGYRRRMTLKAYMGIRKTVGILGVVTVYQDAEESPVFTLQAKYKGKRYTTEAKFNESGEFIYHDSEYAALMEAMNADPDVVEVILEQGVVNFYDKEDIAANRLQSDLIELGTRSGSDEITRGDAFPTITPDILGYVGIHDNDNFGGRKLTHTHSNLHFTWNLPDLRDYSLDNKLTSIALCYNDASPEYCSVLTVWEDPDYNFGDFYRKKHRLNIVASKYNPNVSVANLKKVMKLGTNVSWNDCISSISFHFGYIDTLLSDY